jgi:hypothetical protein
MTFSSAILKLKQNPYANRMYLDDNRFLLAGDPSLEQGTLLGRSQYSALGLFTTDFSPIF